MGFSRRDRVVYLGPDRAGLATGDEGVCVEDEDSSANVVVR